MLHHLQMVSLQKKIDEAFIEDRPSPWSFFKIGNILLSLIISNKKSAQQFVFL